MQIIELGGEGSTVEGWGNATRKGRNHYRVLLKLKPAGDLWEGCRKCASEFSHLRVRKLKRLYSKSSQFGVEDCWGSLNFPVLSACYPGGKMGFKMLVG